jgi:hypothetical protein
MKPPPGLVLYTTPDGTARLQLRIEHKTLWLKQRRQADLCQQTVEQVCRRRMRRSATLKNLGFLRCRPSGKRPWKAFSTDCEGFAADTFGAVRSTLGLYSAVRQNTPQSKLNRRGGETLAGVTTR